MFKTAKEPTQPEHTKGPFAKTRKAAAKACSASERTFLEWTKRAGFPPRTKNKGWDLGAIEDWCKQNSLGKYRTERPTPAGTTLNSARTRHLKERTAREALALQREKIEFEKERGTILLLDEVATLHEQIASTTKMILDTFPDMIDRELPEQCPSAEAWHQVRQRAMLAAKRIARDATSAIERFVADDS